LYIIANGGSGPEKRQEGRFALHRSVVPVLLRSQFRRAELTERRFIELLK
jgi:hypothetical protein